MKQTIPLSGKGETPLFELSSIVHIHAVICPWDPPWLDLDNIHSGGINEQKFHHPLGPPLIYLIHPQIPRSGAGEEEDSGPVWGSGSHCSRRHVCIWKKKNTFRRLESACGSWQPSVLCFMARCGVNQRQVHSWTLTQKHRPCGGEETILEV